MTAQNPFIKWFDSINSDDITQVGGKNASLGEMIQKLKEAGIRIPDGFATTANAYWQFMQENELIEPINAALRALQADERKLDEVGQEIREMILEAQFSEQLSNDILDAYETLSEHYGKTRADVAVRSSATAEDLPEASFAGQQESFLNVCGEEELLQACKKCFASLFTNRAISYREHHGFEHDKVALSVGIQKMVRADTAGSGVAFTLDTETGFPRVVVISAAWGLGETVVQGTVNPDEYLVFKPCLENSEFTPIIGKSLGEKEQKLIYGSSGNSATRLITTPKEERKRFVLMDEEIVQLARWSVVIEDHYKMPMDIEWAKDGESGEMFIVQARPETVQSQQGADVLKTYTLKQRGEVLVKGLSIGEAIVSAPVCILDSVDDIDSFRDGAILVTEVTHPDWVPIMKRASGIITEHGGRTSHAAIVSRELNIPAIVGAANARRAIKDQQIVTLSCAEGSTGYVYEGKLNYDEEDIDLSEVPETRTNIMMNIASPSGAFHWWRLPVKGIGLARMEFIIEHIIKIHPLALINPDAINDRRVKRLITQLTTHYDDPREYFVSLLSQGIAKIAASQYPNPVIVRTSDFKTNEYAALIGGKWFEPEEENPMLGFRGAVRYYDEQYRPGFEMECEAIRRARDEMGLRNVIVMIPFCRTPEEAEKVLQVCAESGLERGQNGLEIYMMSEIPSNVVLAAEFSDYFDGFSIGSNDLTQLVLGVDRDSATLSHLFDERNPAVKAMISDVIKTAHEHGLKVGICGQAPSDYLDFATFLVEEGIDSISVNPDSVIKVKREVANFERNVLR